MFFLCIFIVFTTIFIVLKYSRMQIEIKNFRIYADMQNRLIYPNYEVIFKLYILKNIKIFNKKIKAENLKKQKGVKKLLERLKPQNSGKKSLEIFEPKMLKHSNIQIKQTDLMIELGTENAAITANFIGFLYALIPNLLNHFFDIHGKIDMKFKPLYQNKNQITFSFDGIFEMNLIHIINTYKKLMGKEGAGNKNGASNRKSYAYNNG